MSHRERRTVRPSTVAVAGVLGAALLLAGCDTDGTGVADAGSHDGSHVDTALSTSLEQTAPQPTTGAAQGPGQASPAADGDVSTDPDTPRPTSPAARPDRTDPGSGAGAVDPATGAPGTGPSTSPSAPAGPATASVAFGSYGVGLGGDTLLCSFEEDPAEAGYAWACEAPVHYGWAATDGGEANTVAYRPGGDPEVYALLGNSGITPESVIDAGTQVSVGDRYTVDATAPDAVTVTDTTTGATVRLGTDGYSRQ